jgi:hypothetical protein
MTPYATQFFPQETLDLFASIKEGVEKLPDVDLGTHPRRGDPILLSCHMIVRAVRRVFRRGLKVADGHFHPAPDHSWLITPCGNIIDVYPVGIIGGPILVESKQVPWSPGNVLYKKDRSVIRRVRKDQAEFFDRCVDQVTAALTGVLLEA